MFSGYSEGAVKLLQSSWAPGTVKQYKAYIDRWHLYCQQHKIDPFNGTVNNGVEFLSSLFYDTDIKYSAFNTARSALSTNIPEK